MAPARPIDPAIEHRVKSLAAQRYPGGEVELFFHPQCFHSHHHFAGTDDQRVAAFLDIANSDDYDCLWFARGGYGACRMADRALSEAGPAARTKTYLGFSDNGFLLAGLYANKIGRPVHGPMPADITRKGGEAAVARALDFLVSGAGASLEPNVTAEHPSAAFNICILSQLIGTPLQPDLAGHVIMLEDVSEYLYRLDRFLFHVTSNPGIRKAAGLRLGRCSDIQENDIDFGFTMDEIIRHWCAESGIPYLGTADIGHDSDNKIVPFGTVATLTA